MKKIATLIDFTPTCEKSVEYSAAIAEKAGAELILVHIASDEKGNDGDQITHELEKYTSKIGANISVRCFVDFGSFYHVVPTTMLKLEVDMVIVGTHGKKGLKQNLFGANILKLVKSLDVPCLVIQDESVFNENTFKKLLFPIAPHEHFEVKYRQVGSIAKLFDSEVCIFAIQKDIRGFSEMNQKNLLRTKKYFDENNIKYKEVKQVQTTYSVGYAKDILKFASENNIGTLCIMSKVSKDNFYFGNIDKENILINQAAIPVFCANDISL